MEFFGSEQMLPKIFRVKKLYEAQFFCLRLEFLQLKYLCAKTNTRMFIMKVCRLAVVCVCVCVFVGVTVYSRK